MQTSWQEQSQQIDLHQSSHICGIGNTYGQVTERLQDSKYQGVFCEVVFPKNGCINCTRTMATSTDMLRLVDGGNSSQGLTPDEKLQATNDYQERHNFPLIEPPY